MKPQRVIFVCWYSRMLFTHSFRAWSHFGQSAALFPSSILKDFDPMCQYLHAVWGKSHSRASANARERCTSGGDFLFSRSLDTLSVSLWLHSPVSLTTWKLPPGKYIIIHTRWRLLMIHVWAKHTYSHTYIRTPHRLCEQALARCLHVCVHSYTSVSTLSHIVCAIWVRRTTLAAMLEREWLDSVYYCHFPAGITAIVCVCSLESMLAGVLVR